jgi:hypothetical protein
VLITSAPPSLLLSTGIRFKFQLMKIIKAKAPQEGTLYQTDNIFTFWMLAQMTLCGEIERRYNKYLR